MFHKRLMKEFPEQRKDVAGMVATQWVSLLANAAVMYAIAALAETILSGAAAGQQMAELVVVFLISLLIRMAATSGNSRLSVRASEHVKSSLREKIYEKLMRLGPSYRDTVTTAEAVQISTEGVDQLEIYFGKYVPQFFYSLLAPVTLFVIVGTMSWKVAIVLLLCVPLIPLSIIAVQKFAKKLLAKYWGTYTELGDTFLENLQGLTTLKIYQAEERYAKKMDEEAEKFRKVTMRVLIMQLNSISVMDIVAYGGAAAGMILSILELKAGKLSLAQCFFITMISAEFFLPLRLLGSFFHIAMNGKAAADKIFRLLDAPEREDGKVTELPSGEIVFENVTFGYTPEKRILNQVSFVIPDHSFVAIAGESGCGKSTIASLIMGNRNPDEGCVKIGGVNGKEIEEEARYRKVTRVRHDSYLFRGTVYENLKMGNPDADEQRMEEALKKVDLYETIQEKGGLWMQVEEKAANFSGGQKQRLALARAILHDSDIYIFDEATSNIDAESEDKIMQVVHELAKRKLVILISHRLANVTDADRILVMKAGTIAEMGTHAQLLAWDGEYSRLYGAQQELETYAKEAGA